MGLRREKGPGRWIKRPANGKRKTKGWLKLDFLTGISRHLGCVRARVLSRLFYFHTVFHCVAHLTRHNMWFAVQSLLHRCQIRWEGSSMSADIKEGRKSRVIMQELSQCFLTKPSKVDETATKLKMTVWKFFARHNDTRANTHTQRRVHIHKHKHTRTSNRI